MNIYGLPGAGKTFFAVFLDQFYDRVISNIEITRDGKKHNQTISSISDLQIHVPKKEPHPVKWLVVIDEGWINNNARRSMSESNLEFGQLAMLGRKLNTDIIMIAQLERMNDSYFRELATYTFEVDSHYCKPPRWVIGAYLEFNVTIKNRFGTIIKKIEVDLIRASKKMDFGYSTLETSIIDRKKGTKIDDLATGLI